MDMSVIRQIIRLHEAGHSIGDIARHLKISKSTAKLYVDRIKEAEINVDKLKEIEPEKLKDTLSPNKRSTMNYAEPNWDSIYTRHHRRRGALTLKQLWEEYRDEAPEGLKTLGYQAFCKVYTRFCNNLPEPLLDVALTLQWDPGNVIMVDYAGDKMYVTNPKDGTQIEANIFVGVLASSGYIFCYATPHQTRDDWLDAMTIMFRYFGGSTEYLYLDNTTTLVKRASKFNPVVCDEFAGFCQYYETHPFPVSPGEPTHKGLVENAVGQCTRRIMRPLATREFFTFEELNNALRRGLDTLNSAQMAGYVGLSRRLRYEEELPFLKPLPEEDYEPSMVIKVLKVRRDYLIRYDDCRYSVPYRYVGQKVQVIVRPRKRLLECFDMQTGEKITSHPISKGKRGVFVRVEHMPAQHRYAQETAQERIEHLSKVGPFTQALARYLLKNVPERVANKHLQGLQSIKNQSGDRFLEACCKAVVESGNCTYDAFVKEVDRHAAQLGEMKKEIKPVIRASLHIRDGNVRGAAYYNDKEESNGNQE